MFASSPLDSLRGTATVNSQRHVMARAIADLINRWPLPTAGPLLAGIAFSGSLELHVGAGGRVPCEPSRVLPPVFPPRGPTGWHPPQPSAP